MVNRYRLFDIVRQAILDGVGDEDAVLLRRIMGRTKDSDSCLIPQ